jgi:ankyrin repeat protein
MTSLEPDSPLAVAATRAIREGQVEELERLLAAHPPLAKARIDGQRTLLHVVTDWPGNFPRAAATVAALVAAGADVDAPFIGPHGETPLHWAASSDDLEALDALLTAGADTEAPGSVINGGTALADAVAFGQWRAAHRLVERGARANLWQAAALGLLERVEAELAGQPRPTPDDITNAFWCACHGGQRETAEYLLASGAELDWVGYDDLTPLDAARRSGAGDVVRWLRERGARSAHEPT